MGYARWVGLAAIVTTVACGRTLVAPLPEGADDGISRGARAGGSGGAASGGDTAVGGATGGRLGRGGQPNDEFAGLPSSGGLASGGWGLASGGVFGTGALSASGGAPATGGLTTGGAAIPMCPTGMCESAIRSGIWAVRTQLDVWWDPHVDAFGNQSPLMNPGRGEVIIDTLVTYPDLCLAPSPADVRVCDLELPQFTSNLTCDAYEWSFPEETWAASSMPAFVVNTSFEGATPGDILGLAPITGLIGIDMDNPERAAEEWPSAIEAANFTCQNGAQSGLNCYPDHDGDGMPGITMRLDASGEDAATPALCGILDDLPYVKRGAPLTLDPTALDTMTDQGRIRAVAAHLGLRFRVEPQGSLLSDCETALGTGMVSYLQWRAIECTRADGHVCTAAQAQFFDEQLPELHVLQAGEVPSWRAMFPAWTVAATEPSQGATVRMVRLGDVDQDADCNAVRTANYPTL